MTTRAAIIAVAILAVCILVGIILCGIHRCRRCPDLAAHWDECQRHTVESLDPYRCRGLL